MANGSHVCQLTCVVRLRPLHTVYRPLVDYDSWSWMAAILTPTLTLGVY